MIIKKILIGLTLSTSIYASEMYDKTRFTPDFMHAKLTECKNEFNSTRRQILEDYFCQDMADRVKSNDITRLEIDHHIKEFNERLFDDILLFCSRKYRTEPYVTHLIFMIGAETIKDRLTNRLILENIY